MIIIIFLQHDIKPIQILEKYFTTKAESERADSNFTQITNIYDMKEFGLRHVTVNSGILYNGFTIITKIILLYYLSTAIKFLIEMIRIDEANYPEILGKLFIINSK